MCRFEDMQMFRLKSESLKFSRLAYCKVILNFVQVLIHRYSYLIHST
jgi:hypothetical protein